MHAIHSISNFFKFFCWVVFLFVGFHVQAQSDFYINDDHTVPAGSTEEYNNVTLTSNIHLRIEGTLIVHGNLDMASNKAEFSMGPDANVIVYGDFIAANKVEISVSSYLIIHGKFIKGGSSGQGELNLDNANIYIFGGVDNWDEEFETCGDYQGDTGAFKEEDCDYGTEDDFIDNQEDIPEDLVDLINCYDLSEINDASVCEGGSATFSVAKANLTEVDYRWQVKTTTEESWNTIGSNAPTLSVTNVTLENSGNEYRVLVTPKNPGSDCKISISRIVELIVYPPPEIKINTPSLACYGEQITINGNLIGVPPFQISAEINGESYDLQLNSNSFTYDVVITESLNIKLFSLSDANGCTSILNEEININLSSNTWTGQTSTNWNTASNWGCGIVPTSKSNVLIPGGLTNYPVLSTGAMGTAKNITIEDGASLEIVNNTLEIGGIISNAGTFIASEGSLVLNGNNPQTIPQNTFLNNRIRKLTIDNPANVTLEGNLGITGILKAENGNLNIQDTLALISDGNQTALIDGSGTGEIIGTVKMQRYLDNSFGYKYFSSPFQNSTVGDFSAYVDLSAAFPNFYRYNENRQGSTKNDATGWEVYTTTTSTLKPVEGYALNFGSTTKPVTVELSGTVNNGNYSRTLYNHNGTYTQGFNLVGNPYPSPIDWKATNGWTKTNIDDAIYFFTAGNTNQYTGTYTSYVNGISSSDAKSSNIIPSMQGFFVHVSDATVDTSRTVGTLTMTNEVRINDFSQEFLKQPEKEKYPLLRISAGFEDEVQNDPLVIYFDAYSSPRFEKELDAHKLMNTAVNVPNFYSITPENEKLAINAIPNPVFNAMERIPLGLKTEREGTMLIKLEDLENFSSGAYIYLIDQEKRIAQDLNQNSVYRFQAKKGKQDSRFYLMFSENRLTDPALAFDETFSVTTGNRQISVHINLEPGVQGNLRVSTISGKILEILNVKGKETVEIQGIRSAGIYFINLLSEGENFSKKVLVKE